MKHNKPNWLKRNEETFTKMVRREKLGHRTFFDDPLHVRVDQVARPMEIYRERENLAVTFKTYNRTLDALRTFYTTGNVDNPVRFRESIVLFLFHVLNSRIDQLNYLTATNSDSEEHLKLSLDLSEHLKADERMSYVNLRIKKVRNLVYTMGYNYRPKPSVMPHQLLMMGSAMPKVTPDFSSGEYDVLMEVTLNSVRNDMEIKNPYKKRAHSMDLVDCDFMKSDKKRPPLARACSELMDVFLTSELEAITFGFDLLEAVQLVTLSKDEFMGYLASYKRDIVDKNT